MTGKIFVCNSCGHTLFETMKDKIDSCPICGNKNLPRDYFWQNYDPCKDCPDKKLNNPCYCDKVPKINC